MFTLLVGTIIISLICSNTLTVDLWPINYLWNGHSSVLQSHYGLNFSTKLFIKITDILTMISTFNQSIHTTFDHFKNILSLSPLLLHNSMSRNNFLKYLHCFVWSIFYNSCPAGAVLLSTKVSCESENFQLFVVEKMYHLLLSIYLSPASQGRREVGAGLGADKARVSVRSLVASRVKSRAVERSIGFHNRFSQSRRRPLLGPSPGWKRLLPLSHLRHN